MQALRNLIDAQHGGGDRKQPTQFQDAPRPRVFGRRWQWQDRFFILLMEGGDGLGFVQSERVGVLSKKAGPVRAAWNAVELISLNCLQDVTADLCLSGQSSQVHPSAHAFRAQRIPQRSRSEVRHISPGSNDLTIFGGDS
jgi:hypothetical protein